MNGSNLKESSSFFEPRADTEKNSCDARAIKRSEKNSEEISPKRSATEKSGSGGKPEAAAKSASAKSKLYPFIF
jgi:hypothetical protein